MDYQDPKNRQEPLKTGEKQSRTGLVILAILVIAFGAGYLVTLVNKPSDTTSPNTQSTTGATGANEAAIEPAAGDTTPAPATAAPKIYSSESECRSSVNGACQAVSGGWSSVSQMNGTSTPSDTSGD